jgi:short-subunit dehydrogenase
MARVFRLIARIFTGLPAPVLYTFAGFGACYALPALSDPFVQYYRLNYASPLDLSARYGPKTWAVITGGTDGIGESFAHAFAAQGFNIIILARNPVKLANVAKDIQQKHGVEVKTVQFDLGTTVERRQELVQALEKLKGLEVSILVNNAGVMKVGEFHSEDYDYLAQVINVNCAAHTLISRFFLPIMLARESKSGIINVASVLGKYPLGYSAAYSASKAYHRALSLTLQEEVRGKVDILSLCPGKVNTKLVGRPGERFDTASPDEVVRCALRQLGHTTEAAGAFPHYLISFGGDYVNSDWARYLTTLVYRRFFIKHRMQDQERSLGK